MEVALGSAKFDLEVDEAAQAETHGGDAASEHRRIRNHDHIGGER